MNPNAMAALQMMMGGADAMAPSQSDPTAQNVAQGLSQLRSTNPEMVIRTLQDMLRTTAALIPHTAETIPGVAQFLARNLSGLRGAIDAAQKAMTAQTIAQGPLQTSAAPPFAGGMQ
jgi:hypothetical protein